MDSPRIIALLNEKGGSGKSTLSINLACALHRSGRRVVLVDADTQGTARDWRNASPEGADLPAVVALDRPEGLVSSIGAIAADVIIIDTPAKAERMTSNVIRIAHVAIIPVQPSAADVWASAATVKLINAKRDLGGQIEAAFVSTRIQANAKMSKDMMSGEWNEYGIQQMQNAVSNRVAFAQALSSGVSIYDTTDSAAKAEIDFILQELEAAKWL